MSKSSYSIVLATVLAVGCVVLMAYQGFRGETPLAGSFTPVQGLPFTVSKTVLPTDTTITLSSFKADGYPLTMSSFGAIAYGTLDPNNTARIESISFTGITQNSDGSATLTGVSRGLASTYPYAASTTLEQTHLVGSQFILSNTAAFYGQQFLFANQTGTSTAILVFSSTTPPTYDLDPGAAYFTAAASSTLIDQAQLNRAVLSGCANGTSVLQGCVQLATAKQAASSTVTGSTGANDVLASSYATDTPNIGSNTSDVLMSDLTGYLKQGWLNLTQAFTVTGLWTFNTGGFIDNASSTFTTTLNATTLNAMSGVNLTGNSFTVDGFSTPSPSFIATSSSGAITVTSAAATTTIATTTIPANLLGTKGVVFWQAMVSSDSVQSGGLIINVMYGNTLIASTSINTSSSGSYPFLIQGTMIENGATNSQKGFTQMFPTDASALSPNNAGVRSASIDDTAAQSFHVDARWGNTSNSPTATFDSAYIRIN